MCGTQVYTTLDHTTLLDYSIISTMDGFNINQEDTRPTVFSVLHMKPVILVIMSVPDMATLVLG